ncbi:MAG: hypothetical protein AB1896_11325 [Thermodesulfobacteriota bacterium]
MGRDLDCLKRRSLFNSKNEPAARISALGRKFAEEGFLADAVDFLAKAGDAEGLEALAPRVIEEGDLFLLRQITKALNRPPGRSELEVLMDHAARLGKESFATQARRLLEGEGRPEEKSSVQ